MTQVARESTYDTDRMLTELASSEPHRFAATFFRQLCEKYSKQEAIQICVGLIARGQMPPAAQKWLIGWRMAKDSSYIPVLFDPDFLTLDEAKRALAAFREHDALFHLKLQRFLSNRQMPSRIVLRALLPLKGYGISIPWTRPICFAWLRRIRTIAWRLMLWWDCITKKIPRPLTGCSKWRAMNRRCFARLPFGPLVIWGIRARSRPSNRCLRIRGHSSAEKRPKCCSDCRQAGSTRQTTPRRRKPARGSLELNCRAWILGLRTSPSARISARCGGPCAREEGPRTLPPIRWRSAAFRKRRCLPHPVQ